jgi:hypothetical protein
MIIYYAVIFDVISFHKSTQFFKIFYDYILGIHSLIHSYSCCSHLEHRASVKGFVSLKFPNLAQSVLTLDGGSDRRKAATYTGQHIHRINAHTGISALSEIRIHDPNVRMGEDSS